MTGIKHAAFTEDLDLIKMKQFCKQNSCTIHDYTTSVLSNTLYEYMEKHSVVDGKEFKIPDYITCCMPVSLRQPFEKLEDVRMVNDFVALPTYIKIRKTLDEVLPILKAEFRRMRTSLDVYGCLETFRISVNLPFTLPRYGLDFLANKYTCVYSNLNVSKIPYQLDGRKQIGQFYFPPAVAKFCSGISLSTTGNFMSMGAFFDENAIKDPQELIDIFVRKNKENMERLDKKEV